MNTNIEIFPSITAQSEAAQMMHLPELKEFTGFLKTAGGKHTNHCAYPTRLDTYGCGCAHDCGYCYAKWILRRYNNWDARYPKVADINKIERAVRKLAPGTVVRLGGMVDCFQPLELNREVTLNTIKLLNSYGIGYLIVTKSPIVAYPYYLKLLDPALAHIQITVTALDWAISKLYERCGKPEDRIKAIKELQAQGLDVAIRLSPLVDELMDFDALNRLGINKCIVEFLRINGWMRDKLPNWINLDRYTLSEGNYRHLPLDEKLRIIEKVKIPNVSVCEKVSDHFTHWKENFNPNPDDCCNLRIQPQNAIEVAAIESDANLLPRRILLTPVDTLVNLRGNQED